MPEPPSSPGKEKQTHICILCGGVYQRESPDAPPGFCGQCDVGPAPAAAASPGQAASMEVFQETSAVRRLRKAILDEIQGSLPPSGPQTPQTPTRKPDTESGDLIQGRYKVLQELETTMLSQVFLAFDRVLSRKVVIKYLNFSDRPEHVERFRLEARMLANLKHPNIVGVFDSGVEEGRPYIVMEYIEGIDLDRFNEALGRGKDESGRMRRVLEIVYEVCFALEYLHNQGIVHRDIKPKNVMLDRMGKPFLIDFGIAKQAASPERITATGALIGTLAYMSPEQGRGLAIDQRSDIYSLGVMLYELLTGRPPFTGSSYTDLLRNRETQPVPPPSQINPAVPAQVEKVILRALSNRPEGRYATTREIARDLEPLVMGPVAEIVGPQPRGAYARYRMHLAVGLNALAVILLLLALAPHWGSGSEPGPGRPGELRFVLDDPFDTPGPAPSRFRRMFGNVYQTGGRLGLADAMAVFGEESEGSDHVALTAVVASAERGSLEEVRFGLFVDRVDPAFRGVYVQLRPSNREGLVRLPAGPVIRFRLGDWDSAAPTEIRILKQGRSLRLDMAGEVILESARAFDGLEGIRGVFSLQALGAAEFEHVRLQVHKSP